MLKIFCKKKTGSAPPADPPPAPGASAGPAAPPAAGPAAPNASRLATPPPLLAVTAPLGLPTAPPPPCPGGGGCRAARPGGGGRRTARPGARSSPAPAAPLAWMAAGRWAPGSRSRMEKEKKRIEEEGSRWGRGDHVVGHVDRNFPCVR